MAQIKFNDLEELRKKHSREKIVFCSGCFDLTHAGHVLFFEDCKKHGDILVVMLGSDKLIQKAKGGSRPILNEHLRMKMIDSLKPVDYVFLDYLRPDSPHFLYLLDVVIEKLKPDAYVINADATNIPYRENFSKKHGVPLVILERQCPPEFDAPSTTKIIEKIRKSE